MANKTVGVKFTNSTRGTETIAVAPGTTVSDALKQLKLGGDYQLSNSRDPNVVFRPSDVLYALVDEGDLLYVSAMVDAGNMTVAEKTREPV